MRPISELARRGLSLATVVVVAFLAAFLGTGTANAHGENVQPPTLRTSTVQFYDVEFSKRDVAVGDRFTISGNFFVSRRWAEAVVNPDMTQLTVVAPGPVVLVEDRRIGGKFMPQNMRLEKGKSYNFSMDLVARRPGTWHVHPMISVEGAGPLIGPGVDIAVAESGAASFANFSNPAELSNGERVDLESYNRDTAVLWHLLYIVPAVLFLLYWLRKPLMPRLVAIATGEREPDDYITKRDVKVTVLAGVVILAITGASFVYSQMAWPGQIPLQEKPTASPIGTVAGQTVTAEVLEPGRFSAGQDTVEFKVRLRNAGTETLDLSEFTTANTLFTARPGASSDTLKISGPSSLGPKETADVTLRLASKAWAQQNLVPERETTSDVGGILIFATPGGGTEIAEVNAPVTAVHHI